MAPVRMKPFALRWLTAAEQALAREVFGSGLRPERVRIFAQSLFDRPFTPASVGIVYPTAEALTDFTEGPLDGQATLVHELTHIWQAQHGVILPLAKLQAGDSDESYRYDLVNGPLFPQMNIEQQARVVEHGFVLSRQPTLLSGRPPPFPRELYAAASVHWRQA